MLGNLQVVIVPFVAWAVLAEAPGRRILTALPLTMIGVVLISGALEEGAYGEQPRARRAVRRADRRSPTPASS